MRKIVILLVLLGILFMSSGQTYEQQSLVQDLEKWLPDRPFESLLAKLEIPYWGIKVSVEERGYYAFVEFLIRKSTHFFTFGLIAIVIYAIMPKHRHRLFLAASITVLLAILDEVRQSFTVGRTASLQDVLLDMLGAVTALILLYLIKRLQMKMSAKE